MVRYTLIFAVSLFLITGVRAQKSVSENEIATILSTVSKRPNLESSNLFKHIYDTTFQFEYDSIAFDALYADNFSKHGCTLYFIDTPDKTIYSLQRLQPGYTEWTEEGHRDFSGIHVSIRNQDFFLPIFVPEAQEEMFLKITDHTPLKLQGWLIKKVNGHKVLPVFLVKNVKKAD